MAVSTAQLRVAHDSILTVRALVNQAQEELRAHLHSSMDRIAAWHAGWRGTAPVAFAAALEEYRAASEKLLALLADYGARLGRADATVAETDAATRADFSRMAALVGDLPAA